MNFMSNYSQLKKKKNDSLHCHFFQPHAIDSNREYQEVFMSQN